MNKITLALLLLLLLNNLAHCQVKMKILVHTPPDYGQYRLHILPVLYDSTVTDNLILKYIDTLPAHFLGVKMYNLLYKDDTAKIAIQASAKVYIFRKIHTIAEYWKNGNIRRIAFFRNFKKYKQIKYNPDQTISEKGCFRKNTLKTGKWIYFDAHGKKYRREKYTKNGVLKCSKDYSPHRSTLVSIFNPAHPRGTPYIIR